MKYWSRPLVSFDSPRMYICTYVYIYIDTHTHTHIYIYTHLQFIFNLYPIPEHPYTSSSLFTSQCIDWIYSSVCTHNCNMVNMALSFDILNMYRCSHIFVHIYYIYTHIISNSKISLRLYSLHIQICTHLTKVPFYSNVCLNPSISGGSTAKR